MDLYQSPKTKKVYRWVIKKFYKSIYGEVSDLEEVVERYFSEKRDYASDVKKFFSTINDGPPKSIRLLVSCVKTFLLENEVELRELFWKRLNRRIKGTRAISREKVPSNAELRRILTHLPVQGKALYLTLVSSGMRIGEAMQLTLEDIQLDSDPVTINIRREYTKSGDARITFVSGETKEVLEEWLKIRDKYIKTAVAKSPFKKNEKDERLFPFDTKVAYDQWRNALDKARLNGRDKATNRLIIHPHVLRKFFRSKAGMVSVDMAEALMGHSGYLTDAYRKYPNPEQTLGEFYKQIEPSLEVFGRTGEQFAQLKNETTGLQSVVTRLSSENVTLNQKIEELQKTVKPLEELYQTIVDVFGEEKANEQLKRLFLVNMKAIEEIPYIKK